MTSIDLKDTYFHVPAHPDYRKYQRIVVGGKVFQFKALPFGLWPGPREFCRVTGVLGTLLHKLTIYLHLYLDDWLLRATSIAICLAHTQIALERLLQRRSSSWSGQAFRGSSSKGSGPLQNTAQTTPPDSSLSPSAVRGSQLSSQHHSLRAVTQLFLIPQWSMVSQPLCS